MIAGLLVIFCVQGLIKVQLTDRIDAWWEQRNKAFQWFKTQTAPFLDQPIEDATEDESEEFAFDISKELEQAVPVVEVEEPVSEEDESPIAVLDLPVDLDPLADEMTIPEDPAPVPNTVEAKRRTTKKKVEASLSSLIREEAGKA